MAYLTEAEYLDRFTELETVSLTDPANGDVVENVLDSALEGGSRIVDAYVGARYTVPLDPIPDVIKEIVADLARERLYTMRPVDEVTERANRARAMLKDIAKGIMVLVDVNGRVEDSASDEAVVSGPEPVFGDCLLDSFRGRMR